MYNDHIKYHIFLIVGSDSPIVDRCFDHLQTSCLVYIANQLTAFDIMETVVLIGSNVVTEINETDTM